MPHIEIRDVSLVYDTPAGQVTGVQSASFNIEQSEFLCIVGPSGCGKSTLLNIIAGFLEPTGGVIQIGGKAVKGYGQDRGVVFQDFAQLFPWRTALGNVTFGLEMKGVGKAEREEIARQQLKLVKLEKFANSYPHHLSGGMQQRVAIARALAYNPAVLLMDEPFAALDALTRDDMQRLLADVWRETRKTVIYVTHNVAEAVYLADRVVVMSSHPGTVKIEVPITLAAAARSAQRRIPRLSEAAAAPSRTGGARMTNDRMHPRLSASRIRSRLAALAAGAGRRWRRTTIRTAPSGSWSASAPAARPTFRRGTSPTSSARCSASASSSRTRPAPPACWRRATCWRSRRTATTCCSARISNRSTRCSTRTRASSSPTSRRSR